MLKQMQDHRYFMQKLLNLAEEADPTEVPIAAMIVKNGQIISTGLNTREKEQSVFGHAEINAIKAANKVLNSWNLAGCTIYVSLEPCPMCAGAILQSHITEVIFGAYEYKSGALGSKYNLASKNLKIQGGILEEENLKLLQEFFANLR